jgi:TatD DNase family protein
MAVPLIDTHAHLNFSPFVENPEPWLERARKAGVQAVIVPGVDIPSSEKALELAERYTMIYAAVGIHPENSVKMDAHALTILESFCSHDKCVAVGETGMDFYRDYAPADIQKKSFQMQVELSQSLHLPVIIHNRQADEAVMNVLDNTGYYHGQCHCYTGDKDFAKRCIGKGLRISFTGLVTFAKEIAETAASLPLEALMIETDSPFMAPLPYRGKTNEPAYVMQVALKYAGLFGVDLNDVSRITTRNALTLFSKIDLL